MKVYIQNKFLSLGGGSKVENENKEPVLYVKGKMFSITHKKFIKDLNKKNIFIVRNKYWHWTKRVAFIYDGNKNKIARVVSNWINANNEYIVEGYKDEIKVQGNFFSSQCEIIRNGDVIGTIKRQMHMLVDSFELEAEEADIPFLVALVIAIDNIVDKKRKQLHS